METKKIDDETLGVDETITTQYKYERLLAIKETRKQELATAQENLNQVENLLKKCEELGVGVK